MTYICTFRPTLWHIYNPTLPPLYWKNKNIRQRILYSSFRVKIYYPSVRNNYNAEQRSGNKFGEAGTVRKFKINTIYKGRNCYLGKVKNFKQFLLKIFLRPLFHKFCFKHILICIINSYFHFK